MKLPHLENAVVPERKVVAYLLSPEHDEGAAKARFFLKFGHTRVQWQDLARSLLKHASEHDIVSEEKTAFGNRYVIEGGFDAADGRRPNLRVVWFLDPGSEIPRLITAYPIEVEDD
jgi:hypothetical protein